MNLSALKEKITNSIVKSKNRQFVNYNSFSDKLKKIFIKIELENIIYPEMIYRVLRIRERDYDNNKEETLNKCLEFIGRTKYVIRGF